MIQNADSSAPAMMLVVCTPVFCAGAGELLNAAAPATAAPPTAAGAGAGAAALAVLLCRRLAAAVMPACVASMTVLTTLLSGLFCGLGGTSAGGSATLLACGTRESATGLLRQFWLLRQTLPAVAPLTC